MEVIHKKPQLSDILQQLCDKVQEMLNGQIHPDHAYRLMPENKINSDRAIDIALEIVLRFNADWGYRAASEMRVNGCIEALQFVIPPVAIYSEDPTTQTQLSTMSVQYVLDSLESVAGSLLHFECGPGWCVLYYAQGMVLFMRHGLH